MVFDFIGRTDFSHMPAGRIALDGERVFINLDEPEGTTREEQVLEVHRRYIDIHVPLDAVEEVGWKPLEEIEHFRWRMTRRSTVLFSDDRPRFYASVRPGEFCIVFPEDGHAPAIAPHPFRKLVAKIRVN